jgi:hypothetical protein
MLAPTDRIIMAAYLGGSDLSALALHPVRVMRLTPGIHILSYDSRPVYRVSSGRRISKAILNEPISKALPRWGKAKGAVPNEQYWARRNQWRRV